MNTNRVNPKQNFDPFLFQLDHGFNLLLHGYGSKISVISSFAAFLADHGETVVEVNGFSPSVSMKQVLNDICADLIGNNAHTIDAQVDSIIEWVAEGNRFYLAVHNIDGAMMTKPKTRDVLAKLCVGGVGLIASIDHQNA
jgi:origin recognition complex subunit 2